MLYLSSEFFIDIRPLYAIYLKRHIILGTIIATFNNNLFD